MSIQKTKDKSNNPIFSLAESTKKHWSEMRIFTSTSFGNFEILLESKIDSIKVKKIESVYEPSNEVYIRVNDLISLNEVISKIKNVLNKPRLNIANAVDIQLLLHDDASKNLVTDFANHIVRNKEMFQDNSKE
ncbi:MAG: hypothetical protein N3G74_00145 [Candidatus Micrarchaeota archaeon]|nr:hypothetical protein [Candidatus Micrarchaeota archaeon]